MFLIAHKMAVKIPQVYEDNEEEFVFQYEDHMGKNKNEIQILTRGRTHLVPLKKYVCPVGV